MEESEDIFLSTSESEEPEKEEFPYRPIKRPYKDPPKPDPYGEGIAKSDEFKKLLMMYPEEKRSQNQLFMEKQWDYWIRKGVKAEDILTGLDYLIWKYKQLAKDKKGVQYNKPLPILYWVELWIFLRDELWIKEKSDLVKAFPSGGQCYENMNRLVSRPYFKPIEL